MELTELRYFYNVATARSFARGAELSHVTPPAISKAVKKLEEELGAELLVRTTRRVSLTDRGEILLQHCRSVFRQLAEMHRDLDDCDETIRGDLRIAANEVFSIYLLPNALSRVVRRHAGLHPRCFEMVPDQIEHGLLEGDLDIGFTIGAQWLKNVDRHLITESPGVLVVGRDHPLYDVGVVTADDLTKYPSVVPRFFKREYMTTLDQFPEARYPRAVGATIELMQMGVQMVIDGAYMGYFPAVTIRCYINKGELKILDGLEPGMPFRLQALTRKGAKPRAAAMLVIDELRETIRSGDAHPCAI